MNKTVPSGAAILLDFIRDTEVGRSDRASYDVIYGNQQNELKQPLTRMSCGEIINGQKAWSRHYGSSACGGYQFLRATLIGLLKELPSIRGTDIFTPDLQDRLGYHLLKRRGYEDFEAGRLTLIAFGKRLAQEWASFPVLADTKGASRNVKRGQSYYAGDGLNKALVRPEKVEAVLKRVLEAARRAREEAAREVPMPVSKRERQQKPIRKSGRFWTWLLTAGMEVIA
jgi:muramidase (phage lysozyme)